MLPTLRYAIREHGQKIATLGNEFDVQACPSSLLSYQMRGISGEKDGQISGLRLAMVMGEISSPTLISPKKGQEFP